MENSQIFFKIIDTENVLTDSLRMCIRLLRGCPELECSRTAFSCDSFWNGKKETKLLDFEVWFYIYSTNTKDFF